MHSFCPSSSAWQSEDFVIFLSKQGKTHWTIKYTKNYALKYGHVVDTGDASALAGLSPCNRQHAMSALASLSKYTGRYDSQLNIRRCFNLKWSSGNDSLQAMERFFNPDLTLDSMVSKIREMIRVLPKHMAEVITFACLLELGPGGVCESVNIKHPP